MTAPYSLACSNGSTSSSISASSSDSISRTMDLSVPFYKSTCRTISKARFTSQSMACSLGPSY